MSLPQDLGALLLVLGALFLTAPATATTPDTTAYDPGRAAFTVQFGEELISRRVMAVPVMPDTSIRIAVEATPENPPYRIEGPPTSIRRLSSSAWRFVAPNRPGLYPLTLTDPTTEASVRIQVFVLRTWNHDGTRLNGYRLGRYEMDPRRNLETYEPPGGFIEVTADNKDVPLSPNFRLEQFLCKQTDETPQYALVRTRLLQRLERILAAVNAERPEVPTLHVMSGFRTPHYNRAIGNTTEYSRHLYGDAADIFVDVDGDQWMDDLTGDGRVTRADARHLASIVRRTASDHEFSGGLAVYGATAHHGPFVHLDLRGYRARW